MKRTKRNTLSAQWSKRENDIVFSWPDGLQTKVDGHLLHNRFDNPPYNPDGKTPPLIEELVRRGYDLKTLRFSIMKDPNHPRWASPSPSEGEKK